MFHKPQVELHWNYNFKDNSVLRATGFWSAGRGGGYDRGLDTDLQPVCRFYGDRQVARLHRARSGLLAYLHRHFSCRRVAANRLAIARPPATARYAQGRFRHPPTQRVKVTSGQRGPNSRRAEVSVSFCFADGSAAEGRRRVRSGFDCGIVRSDPRQTPKPHSPRCRQPGSRIRSTSTSSRSCCGNTSRITWL